MRPPLRFVRLELRRAEGPAEPTEIELLKLECVTEVTPASGLVLEPVLVKGEEAGRLRLIVGRRNLLSRPMGGRLEITASAWNGDTLKTEIREDLLAPGIAETVEWDLPLPTERHYVEAAVRFLKNGETLAERTASFTRPPDRKPDRDLRPGSPWGMGVYLYRYPNTPEGLEQMETVAGSGAGPASVLKRSWRKRRPSKSPGGGPARRVVRDLRLIDSIISQSRGFDCGLGQILGRPLAACQTRTT